MILSGTLLTPTGQPFGLALVKLVARETSPSVLQTVAGQFVTDELGAYSFDCPIGRYSILVYTGNAKSNIGNITITEDTTETDINSLIILEQTAIPSNPFLQEIRQSLVDAELAATQAEASATAAATSATQAEAAKDDLLATVIALELDDLQDVVVPTPTTGDVLTYNGTTWSNAPSVSPTHTHDDATVTTSGFMSAADKSKLDGVQAGATANSTDATLLDRSNHIGTQTAATISDLNESVQDMLSTFLVPGSNVTMVYDDVNNTLTIGSTGGGGGAGGTVETVAISAGALNLSAVTADTVRVALNANVTSLTLPAGEAGKRKDLMIEFTHDNTATVYTVNSSGIVWDGGTPAAILNTANAKTYWILSNIDNTGWAGFVDQASLSATLSYIAESRDIASPNNTTPVHVLTPVGTEAAIDLALVPKGLSALLAQVPTNSTAGGGKRGSRAVDFQMFRSLSDRVASGNQSVVVGGGDNAASHNYAGILAGYNNRASGQYSGGCAGFGNQIQGEFGFIGAGQNNTMSGTASCIVGGSTNTVSNNYSVVVGGSGNQATGLASFTGGGATVRSTNSYAVACGGDTNLASGTWSFLGGGQTNTVNNSHSVVVGGQGNTAGGSSTHATVCGGQGNQATGFHSVVVGGNANTASGTRATVLGGDTNQATGSHSLAGGFLSVSSGDFSAVLGGYNNSANGYASTVLGGEEGTARSVYGMEARANGRFNAQGDAQRRRAQLRRATTNTTPTDVTTNNASAGTTNQFILPNNSAFSFKGTIIARDQTTGDCATWDIAGLIKRGANATTTALVGTPTDSQTFADAAAVGWDVVISADTTNGGLNIKVVGHATNTVRWVADVQTVEVTG